MKIKIALSLKKKLPQKQRKSFKQMTFLVLTENHILYATVNLPLFLDAAGVSFLKLFFFTIRLYFISNTERTSPLNMTYF